MASTSMERNTMENIKATMGRPNTERESTTTERDTMKNITDTTGKARTVTENLTVKAREKVTEVIMGVGSL